MSARPDNLQFDAPTKEPTEMKIPAAMALCALTLTVAGCTTSDDTPPGSVAGLAAAEEGDEEEGISEVDELDPSVEEAEAAEEEAEGEGAEETSAPEEGAEQTAAPEEGAEQTAAPGDDAAQTAEPEDEEGNPGTGANSDSGLAPEGSYPNANDMSDEVCEAYFVGAAPLAGRVDDTRLVVRGGVEADLSPLEYQEVDVLSQRLTQLAETGSDDQLALFERINAPFTDVVAAGEGEEGDVSYDEIETADSDAAQQEFIRECLAVSGLG